MNNDGRLSSPSGAPEVGPFPWKQGWEALRSTWPQLVYISTVSIAIPQCLLYWFQSQAALEIGESFVFQEQLPMLAIMDRLKSYFFSYSAAQALCFFVSIIGYLSLVALLPHSAGQGRKSTVSALRQAVRAFLPGGLLVLLLLIPFASIVLPLAMMPNAGLIIKYVIITLFVLLAAFPILLVSEPRSPLAAIKQSLRLSYASGSGISKWSVFFVLLTYEMALFASFYFIDFCYQQILYFDQTLSLSRGAWFWTSQQFPFGIIPFILNSLVWILSSLALGCFAVFTSSFVRELGLRRSQFTPSPQVQSWV